MARNAKASARIPVRFQAITPTTAADGQKIVAITPNYWGAGDTLPEALANVVSAGGGRFIARGSIIVYLVPDGFEVSPIDGRLSWPGDQSDGVLLFDGRSRKDKEAARG